MTFGDGRTAQFPSSDERTSIDDDVVCRIEEIYADFREIALSGYLLDVRILDRSGLLFCLSQGNCSTGGWCYLCGAVPAEEPE